MIVKIALFLLLLAVLLAFFFLGIIIMRTARVPSQKRKTPEKPVFDHKDALHAAQSLSEAISYQTVSQMDPTRNEYGEWARLRDYLRSRFPLVHQAMEREIIGGYSLLFRWPSEKPEREPILFCGHLDVVPASGGWTHPPFKGAIDSGYVWGRGTLDCKNIVICLLEAAEGLIASNFRPKRDIYFAFGHDEEIGGTGGAKAAAKLLTQRGITFAMVLDEGGSLCKGIVPIDRPVAQISVSEKGFVNIKMSVSGAGGHASTPPPHTALGILSEAIGRIEFRPRPAQLTTVIKEYLQILTPDLPYSWKLMVANLWLFKRSLCKRLSRDPGTNALIRTTIAPTMSQCGLFANVLPDSAEAVLNARLIHGDTDTALLQYLQDLTADLGMEFEVTHADNPSLISDYQGEMFSALRQSIEHVFPDIPVVPSIMCGGSDARYYETLSPCVFRFCPFIFTPDDQKAVHNVDERILVDSLGAAVVFYRDLIERLS